MRIWCEVYDANDNRLGDGPILSITGASVTRSLDGQGSFNLSFPLTDERALNLLTAERRVRIYVEEANQKREFGRGTVRERTVQESDSGRTLTVSGPDGLDELTRRNVLLGRSYSNTALSSIAATLVGLVPGWSVSAESGLGNQTAQFDGANILKAVIRLAEEKGLHIRQTTSERIVEIGAFGADSGLRAISPPSTITQELYANDEVLLIDRITVKTSSRDVVNWIIPLGAGEGLAAQTLKESTRTTPYAKYSMTGPDGRTLYYLKDTDSIAAYGQIERVVTFKEIGPIANSAAAKELTANALHDAASQWLTRNKDPLDSYQISVRKLRQSLRPGDKIRVIYKGVVQTETGKLTYIDVDGLFWVMKVTESVGQDGLSATLEVNSVDRYEMDLKRIMVSTLEAINVRNVSVQTYPVVIPFIAYDTLQEGTSFGSGYSKGKKARLDLRINSYITDVFFVELRFITFPLHTTSRNVFSTPNYWTVFDVITSDDYPSGISIFINGTDRTTALGGPWNAGSNSQTHEVLDISQYILDDAGGIYQNHTIELHCEHRDGDISLGSPDPSQSGNASKGLVLMIAYVHGSMRSVAPS